MNWQYQDLKLGDEQQLGRRGPVLRVARLEPERCLVFALRRRQLGVGLRPGPIGQETRLISRNRIAIPGSSRLVREAAPDSRRR
jgi:hypothetical protein